MNTASRDSNVNLTNTQTKNNSINNSTIQEKPEKMNKEPMKDPTSKAQKSKYPIQVQNGANQPIQLLKKTLNSYEPPNIQKTKKVAKTESPQENGEIVSLVEKKMARPLTKNNKQKPQPISISISPAPDVSYPIDSTGNESNSLPNRLAVPVDSEDEELEKDILASQTPEVGRPNLNLRTNLRDESKSESSGGWNPYADQKKYYPIYKKSRHLKIITEESEELH